MKTLGFKQLRIFFISNIIEKPVPVIFYFNSAMILFASSDLNLPLAAMVLKS
jgi:hypothetical protein